MQISLHCGRDFSVLPKRSPACATGPSSIDPLCRQIASKFTSGTFPTFWLEQSFYFQGYCDTSRSWKIGLKGAPKWRITTGPFDRNGIKNSLTAVFSSRFMVWFVKNWHMRRRKTHRHECCHLCVLQSVSVTCTRFAGVAVKVSITSQANFFFCFCPEKLKFEAKVPLLYFDWNTKMPGNNQFFFLFLVNLSLHLAFL